ncbi:hypothetical protein [Streptomyces atratus]|uniref:hypothetical protein n=1 Tax=Streptomyces atratus TaxID=1893 RepID=UPI0033F3817B
MTSWAASTTPSPSPPWNHRLDECAEPVCDPAESTRSRGQEVVLPDGRAVPDLRLVGGRHLQPGARYRSAAPEDAELETLVVREWRRGSATAVEQVLRTAEFSGRVAVRLRNPDRPGAVEIEGHMRGPEGASGWSGALRRGSRKAELDLSAWWAAAVAPGAPPPARAPATARLEHRLGRARPTLTPRAAEAGGWRIDVALTVRGRGPLRPLAAIALLFVPAPLPRGFVSSVVQAAAR